MNSNFKKLMMAAAVSGLVGGATTLQAAPEASTNAPSTIKASNKAGKLAVKAASNMMQDKHGCKGKNDCKGQGGCKTGDNGCKGKNSCKGKGGCATDGSKLV